MCNLQHQEKYNFSSKSYYFGGIHFQVKQILIFYISLFLNLNSYL